MVVKLAPEIAGIIQGKIDSGRYGSAEEVVYDALRLMDARDIEMTEVRDKIAAVIASAKAGRLSDGDAFFDQLDSELDQEIRKLHGLVSK